MIHDEIKSPGRHVVRHVTKLVCYYVTEEKTRMERNNEKTQAIAYISPSPFGWS